MCCCALRDQTDKSSKKVVATCTLNLAVAYSQADPSSGRSFYNQAIQLTPADANLYFELGKTLNDAGNYQEAVRALEDALKIKQHPYFWSELALAYSGQYKKSFRWPSRWIIQLMEFIKAYNKCNKKDPKELALYACDYAMNSPSEMNEYILKQLIEALSNIYNGPIKAAKERKDTSIITKYIKLWEISPKELPRLDDYLALILPKLVSLYEKSNSTDDKKRAECFRYFLNNLDEKNFPHAAHSLEFFSQLEKGKDDKGNVEFEEVYRNQLEQLKGDFSNWNWGYAQVLLQLSDIESNKDNTGRLDEAIKKLQTHHPLEIRKLGLYGRLAQAFMGQNKFDQALHNSQRSVVLDPESAWERSVLSNVYQSCQSVEEAISQLDICLSINPHPQYLMNMANSQFQLIRNLNNKENQQKALIKYDEILQRLLKLTHSEWINEEEKIEEVRKMHSWSHFWLGLVHQDLNNYDKAISNLTEALNLSYRSKGRSDLVAMLYLGKAYFDLKAYNECEDMFTKLINYFDDEELARHSRVASWVYPELENFYCIPPLDADYWLLSIPTPNGIPLTIIDVSDLAGSEFGFSLPLDYLVGDAYLSLSFSYAQRDINLIEAHNLADKAKWYIRNLDDKSLKAELEAMHADCKGWLLYKQAKLGDGTSDIKEAIDSLEEAVCKRAEPEYYLHLALALEYILEIKEKTLKLKNSDEAEFQRYMHRALACCDHVIDMDFQEKYTEKAKELKKRLQDLKPTAVSEAKSEPDPNQGYA